MTYDQQQIYNELMSSVKQTEDDKKLYCSIIQGLVTASGFNTKTKALKEKADELFYGVKHKPYKY